MKLPAKIEYAYKAVFELSLRYGKDNPVQLNTISEAQGIPKKFLIQLLLRLKSANIVDSSRGISGGYNLVRPPSRISLADVFRAIDDSLLLDIRKAKGPKGSEAGKLILSIWQDIGKQITGRLESITFDQLIAKAKNEQLTYYI
jgi:Rrf2 family protein